MSKVMDPAQAPAPAHDVPQWPLVLGLCLLAFGAVLNMRLGKDRVALILLVAAVVIPLAGIFLRKYLGLGAPPQPRIRRVVVNDDDRVIATVPLESAKYLTPAPRPGLSDRPSDGAPAQA